MFPLLLDSLRFAQQGINSNLWGLGCPFYCTSPSVGLLKSGVLLGFIAGFIFGLWAAYRLYIFTCKEETPVAQERPLQQENQVRGRRRLIGYVDGQ